MSAESIALRFKDGRSDKVYNVTLIEDSEGWLVNFAYGRYGKPLRTGTKTAKPIPYDQAKYAYDKLVTEKMSKGYTEDGSGTPFTGSQIAPERTGWLPQLLNPVELEGLLEAISDWNTVWAQIKHDGERRGVLHEDGQLTFSNRRGLKVDLDSAVKFALRQLTREIPFNGTIDCEDMGGHLVIFDHIVSGFEDATFEERAENLDYLEEHIYKLKLQQHLRVDIPRLLTSAEEIRDFINEAHMLNHEGVVFRQGEGTYSAGRPNSGGPCLKLKFYASATCIVDSVHPTKRSIGLRLIDAENGQHVKVGNCTIPPNYDIPSASQLVEIKYLYAYRGGSIYQPQYKGVRNDMTLADATLDQLKYKEEK